MLRHKTIRRELKSFGVRLEVIIPNESKSAFDEIISNTFNFICNGEPLNAKEREFKIIFSYGKNAIKLSSESLTISENADFNQIGKDAADATLKIFEREVNKLGIFSIHGACVSCGENGTLILGETGSGKTTTALKICILNDDVRFVTGNRVFLSGDAVIGGVSSINVRVGSIISEFRNAFPQIALNQHIKGADWEHRVYVQPKDVGVKINQRYPLKLCNIIVVKKLPKNIDVKVVSENGNDEKFQLYDDISRWGDRKPYLAGSSMHYPEIFTRNLKQMRLNQASQMLTNIPFLYINGRLDSMADHISKLIRA